MKKSKYVKAIKLKTLEKLIEDENSCIFMNRIVEHLVLHPYHLSDLKNSVNEILNKEIARYCPKLDGILCGYKDVKFLSDIGKISNDSVYIHVDIEADFYVFKPTPEKRLVGIINKISKDHVGCLVHNIFNVSLPKPKHADDWIGHNLTPKSEVIVEIKCSNFDGKLPYIRGEIVSLVEENNGENLDETPQKSKKKRRKESESNVETDSDKKKRRKESELNIEINGDKKKHGKKRKKHSESKELETPNKIIKFADDFGEEQQDE